MRLDYTIWMYLLIVIAILLVLLRNQKNFAHSLIFSLVIGLLFLLIAKSPNDVDTDEDDISCIAIYFTIIFLSAIVIIIYAGIMSYENLDNRIRSVINTK
jgi:hypothetical protein